MKFLCSVLLFVLSSFIPVYTQHMDTVAWNEAMIHKYLKKLGTKSVAVGIIDGDQEYVKCYGKMNTWGPKHKTPDRYSLYEIGSITKVFTSLLLADLIQKDSIDLDDKVVHYLPRPKDSYAKNLYDVSFRHLSTHASGLPAIGKRSYGTIHTTLWWIDTPINAFKIRDPYAHYDEKKLLKDLRKVQFRSLPGTQFRYSNLGAGILGYTLGRIAKMPYANAVKTIFDSLGMNNTWIHLPKKIKKEKMATGHNWMGVRKSRWTFGEGAEGAGAVVSCMDDMMKFLKANVLPSAGNMHDILAYSHQTYFVDSLKNETMGLGWIKTKSKKTNNKEIIWHNGGTGGFHTFIGYNKETQTGVIILSNCAKSIDKIAFEILLQAMKKKSPGS